MGRLRIVGHGAAMARALVALAVVGGCLGAAAYAAKAPSRAASGAHLTAAGGGSVGARSAPVPARPAQADQPHEQDPNRQGVVALGGKPFPPLQYLPCGWDWDGVNWIPPQP